METKLTINLKTILIIIIGIIILFGGGFSWLGHKLNTTNDKLYEQYNLTEALQDDIRYTTNKLNEEVATKKTLQAGIENLYKQNLNLSENQKELMDRINDVKNKNEIISAALVNTQIKLDSALFNNVDVDVNENDTSINFTEINDTIQFEVKIGKAVPAIASTKPTITFDKLLIPNKQYIEFTWDNDKEYKQKPVSFSITNSNPMIKTIDVDSYIIPEVNKNVLKPTGIQKIGSFFKERKIEIIVGVSGLAIGAYIGATSF